MKNTKVSRQLVISKETGTIVSVRGDRPADPRFYIPYKGEEPTAEETAPVVEENMTEGQARFAALKEKGWKSLSSEERAEYSQLKKQFDA